MYIYVHKKLLIIAATVTVWMIFVFDVSLFERGKTTNIYIYISICTHTYMYLYVYYVYNIYTCIYTCIDIL